MKKISVIFILFGALNTIAQHKVSHFVGLDVGTHPYRDDVIRSKFETNANYILRYRLLSLKTQVGITPFTNFGHITKFGVQIGILTNPQKKFSYFLYYGGCKQIASKEDYQSNDSFQRIYTYRKQTNFLISTGFFIKPKNHEFLKFGFEAKSHFVWITTNSKAFNADGYILNLNASIYIIINKK